MHDLPMLLAGFRSWILDEDPEKVIDKVCAFCRSDNARDGAGAALLAVTVSLGLRAERIYTALICELAKAPRLISAALERYGDPEAVPLLEALFDQMVVTPDNAADVRAVARAIVRLGGVLSVRQGAKLIDALGGVMFSRFAELMADAQAQAVAEPSPLDVLDRIPRTIRAPC